jgi:DNA-directed RNA polymerases I and III subunit RPAC2
VIIDWNNARNYLFQLAGDENSGENSRTFLFIDEGHTLGNVLKSIIGN